LKGKIVCIHTVTGDVIAELVKEGEATGDLYVKFPTRLVVQMDMTTGQPTPPQFVPACILNPDPELEVRINRSSIVFYYEVDESIADGYRAVMSEHAIEYKAKKSNLTIAKNENDVKEFESKLKLLKPSK